MSTRHIIVFSSVRMEYVTKVVKLTDLPVRWTCALSEQDYRRLAAGGTLARFRLRVQMYVTYPLQVLGSALLAGPRDVLLVSSNTFYAPLLAWLGSRLRRPRLLHWRCDLYPDALVVARTIRSGGAVEKAIGGVQRLMNRTCDGVVNVGSFLRQHAEARWGVAPQGYYIDNVPSNEAQFAPRLECRPGLAFHYGGQLGYMHEPDSLLAFVRAGWERRAEGVRFDFRVSGAFRARFAAGVAEMGLKVEGPIPNDKWKILIEDFQVGLVSLSPGGATVSLPSKLYSMMAGGLAIVAVCPYWSDLARIVRDTGCGWVVNNSPFTNEMELHHGDYLKNCALLRDGDAILADSRALVDQLLRKPDEVERCRRAAVRAAHEVYGLAALRRAWAEVFATDDTATRTNKPDTSIAV